METSAYLPLYLQEMRENCARLGGLLVEVEKRPSEQGLLQEIMRFCHSCKGISATMGFVSTADLCHALEEVFDCARQGTLDITPDIVDVCLKALDALNTVIQTVDATKNEPPSPDAILTELHACLKKGGRADRTSVSLHSEDIAEIPHVRVDSKRLDSLLELAGELSVLRLQMHSQFGEHPGPVAGALLDRFARVTDELSYEVMQSRLVPLEQVFLAFPRLVRDLARSQKKQVKLVMKGTDVELDKTLVDHLVSPLVHLLRNAIDHGIEPPEERTQKKKLIEGTVVISVAREHGFVTISVTDDGRKIECEAVKQSARKRGFSPQEIDAISDATLLTVLASGRLSTSKEISLVSGRGVGLSAVRSGASVLGGELVFAQSEKEKSFTLRLPLAVSVVRILFVRSSGQTYGLPFSHIERLLTVPRSSLRSPLGQPLVVLDDESIAVFRLKELLSDSGRSLGPLGPQSQMLPLVLLKSSQSKVAIEVEEVLKSEEVMVKSVGSSLSRTPHLAGSTIMGDGSVAFILDPHQLIGAVRTA